MNPAPQPPSPQARNAIRHGLQSGQLPKHCGYISRTTAAFRAAIEDAVLARHGHITITQAATIQSVMRWERHALLCQRWLRTNPGLTADQQLAFSRDAARASAERDKCLRLLDLDREDDPMASLLAQFSDPPLAPDAAERIEAPPPAEPCSGPLAASGAVDESTST